MRPPGYVRPLPFDSIDPQLAAAGIDLEAWHRVRVLADRRDQAQAPEGEHPPGNWPEDHIIDLVEGRA